MHSIRTHTFPFPGFWSPVLSVLAAGVTALVAGCAIALEKWLIVAGIFGILLLLAWPVEVALGLYVFLVPFESMTTTTDTAAPAATLLRYVGGMTLLVIVLVSFLRGRIVKPPRAALFWSALVFWGVASSVWAIDPALAARRISTALSVWLLYLGLVSVRLSAAEFSRVALSATLGGCGAAAYACYSFARNGSTMQRASLMEGSATADPNFFAATLLLPFALAIGEVFSSGKRTRRLFFVVNAGIIAVAILLTMSRGALAAVTAVTFVFLLRYGLKWRLLVPVALLGVALLFVPQKFFERMHEVSTTRMAGRLDIWMAGVRAFGSHAAIGAGLENFARAYDEHSGSATFFAGGTRASHNVYLATAVELGVPGLLLLLAALSSHLRVFRQFRMTLATSGQLVAFEAACWGMLVAGLSLDLLWRKAFWLVWALPVLAMRAAHEHQHEPAPERWNRD